MGAESARRYNRDMAKTLNEGIQRILDRINPKYAPYWLLEELHTARHKAQCIQQEFERVMKDFKDKI